MQVFNDGFFIQLDGATSGGSFGRSIRQFKGLFTFQVGKTFDFQNTSRKDILLALLFRSKESHLNGRVGDGLDQITEGDTGLHFSVELNEDRFGHVQRHDTRGGRKGHETRTSGKGNTNGETSVRITTGTDGIRQEHAVEPRMNDTITRTQTDTAAGANKVGQRMVRHHVNRLGVGGRVTKGLHDQIRRKSQTRQTTKFIPSHGTRRILRSDRGHEGFTVLVRNDTFSGRQSTRFADHFLGQGESFRSRARRYSRQDKDIINGGIHTECFACLGGNTTSNNEGNTSSGTDFVQNDGRLEFKFGNDFTRFVILDNTLLGIHFNDVSHVESVDIHFNGQGTGIFHGIKENGSNLATNTQATRLDVGYIGDFITHEPQYRVGGRLARTSSPHDITDIGQGETLGLQIHNLLNRSYASILEWFDPLTCILEHSSRMEWNIRTRPRILRGTEIIGIRFSRHLEDGGRHDFWDFRFGREPFGGRPTFQYLSRSLVSLFVQIDDIMKGIKYQKCMAQLFRRFRSNSFITILEQIH
mmetsp:Transcript_9394/g.17930  ORF Transcript_9394/g.17930 Transcript_9394/m.17930 type:complete len:528 (+) Transcript_9394:888-2471(+)